MPAHTSRVVPTPGTADASTAAGWLERCEGGGVDGVVAKHRDLRYRPGVRAMVKVKRERTADCVVAGFRRLGELPVVSSLMLGLYDESDRLAHVGVVTAFPVEARRALHEELMRLASPLAGHPWERGFLLEGGPMGRLKGSAGRWTPEMGLDWQPLAPVRVAEVAFDQLDGRRFRHPARFRRWRPDRDALSCRFDQLEVTVPLGELIPAP